MKTNIVKIEGNKIEAIVDNDVQEYELAEWVKPEYVELGEAEITVKDGEITFCSMIEDTKDIPKKREPGYAHHMGPSRNKNYTGDQKTESKWEDDIVSFEQLLTAAHNKKIPFSIKTQLLQIDLEKKYALFKASVIVNQNAKIKDLEVPGIVFEGHGDATAENVTGDFIKPHFIRMAETRAIVRALRWYTNNGCAEEEK